MGQGDPASEDTSFQMAALGHAQAMTTHASDLRMKNFNFFIVIMGIVIAGYVKLGSDSSIHAIGICGTLVSLGFLVLDFRGRELLDAAKAELALREAALGISIQARLVQAKRSRYLAALVSHTFVYRLIYVAGLFLSLNVMVSAP
jgi:hypothetical protein